MTRYCAALLGVLLAALCGGCDRVETVAAPTQITVRIGITDKALLDELTLMSVSVALREGESWKTPQAKTLPKDVLRWPVDIPVTPRVRADASKQFEVVVEALDGRRVLAQARAVTSFFPDERWVLELWLHRCGSADEPAVCAEPGCHGEGCGVCTARGECVPVGVTGLSGLLPLNPSLGADAGTPDEDAGPSAVRPSGRDADANEEGGDEVEASVPMDAAFQSEGGAHAEAGAVSADSGTPDTGSEPPEPAPAAEGGMPDGGAPVTPASLPPIADYGARGPFEVSVVNDTGKNGDCTVFRPTTLGTLGAGSFKHPIATWGNAITTTPTPYYSELLSSIASHGFVVIASNNTAPTAVLLSEALDWLIAQNDASGAYQGKLDPRRAVAIGYSLGGLAAIGAGAHSSVVATVALHAPPGPAENVRGPLLLLTGAEDSTVPADATLQNLQRSTVQTFFSALDGADHLLPLGDGGQQRAPAVAWLRLWAFGDQNARRFFYGADCTLCQAPWLMTQRKNWQ